MQGFRVHRKAGWDTHGLPVELSVEKSMNISKDDIGKKITVEEYNNACRTEVMKYTREWEELTRIMGYWVNMDDPYITYDNRYIENSLVAPQTDLFKRPALQGLHHSALFAGSRNRTQLPRTEISPGVTAM